MTFLQVAIAAPIVTAVGIVAICQWQDRRRKPMPPMPLAEIAARRKLGMPPEHPEKLATVLSHDDEEWLDRLAAELWGPS